MEPYLNRNHPVVMVSLPHPNDVLFGRGGRTNHHWGNKKFRKIVEKHKQQYCNERKRCRKRELARKIIDWVRYQQDPPGRFLKYDDDDGAWRDVGDKEAREKTSQSLREKNSNLPQERCNRNNGVDCITGPNLVSASTTDVPASTKELEWQGVEEQKIDDTYLDPEYILCEPVPEFAYANSNSIDDIHNPPLHIPTRSSSIDDQASGRMHSLMDVNHPSPHAELNLQIRMTQRLKQEAQALTIILLAECTV